MLNWLWGIVPLILFFIWATRRRERMLNKFVQKQLKENLTKNYNEKRAFQKNILLVIVFVLSIIALARPQWGFEWREIKREGIDILIAIDTSKSMLTEDVKPNRLERTKLAVKDLIKRLRGDRLGLIAFSGKAFLVCPFTMDYQGFLLSLEDLDAKTIPRGSTNIAAAIKESMRVYEDTSGDNKILVILTDGENLEEDPLKLAKQARDEGVKIYCVGIGTKDGELIRVRDASGNYEFFKDAEGNYVKSRLNEKILQEIALTTGGVYIRASGAQFGLDLIFERELAKFEKREIESQMEKRYYERFQIPLAFMLILFVIEMCLPYRKKESKA
ncbi:MAG: VWA domain-containing protein [Candidatus Omnitrophica bacterium]|nr:VWA domain-containing protein [Candidatus Omnitrophota bacterium]